MNWYKLAIFDIRDFKDRNLVNAKIKFLQGAAEYLLRLSKIVYQDARYARNASNEILQHQKMSSYPVIKDLLLQADKIALDSPQKFAEYCKLAAEEIVVRADELKQKRREFSRGDSSNHMKGIVDVI